MLSNSVADTNSPVHVISLEVKFVWTINFLKQTALPGICPETSKNNWD